jgi:hypothetical protein
METSKKEKRKEEMHVSQNGGQCSIRERKKMYTPF